jgi:DNA repair exonuclease SbcCD ATPase subunit
MLAEKELQEANEKQEILKGAKEKHGHIAQRYHDYQKDLDQLAEMQEEKLRQLRALHVPSIETTLGASMSPMIKGVIEKYPDIV